MSVVVTGAAGFLGRALVASLAADGIAVVAVDRRPPPAAPASPPLRADLLDRRPGRAPRRCGPRRRGLPPRRPARGTGHRRRRRRRPDQGQRAGDGRGAGPACRPDRRWSSPPPRPCTAGPRGRPSRENDPLRPLGAYARSKAAVELLCAGRPVAVLRPFTVAGEGQRPDMALARWIAAVRAGRPIRILGSPERGPGTSPTCGTWSGRPGWRPSGGWSGRSTSAPAGRARWPSWPARSAGCSARRPSCVVRPGDRGRAGRDLGRHHPTAPARSASCR